MEDWKTDRSLRQTILSRIRSAAESTNCHSTFKQKTPEELESNICSKVKTREQYLQLAQKLVLLLEGKSGPGLPATNQQMGPGGVAAHEGQLHGQQMQMQQGPQGMQGMMRGQMGPVSQLQARLTGARMPQQPVVGMAPDGGPGNMAQQQRMKMVGMPQQPGGMPVVSSAAGVVGPNMSQQQASMVQAQRMKMAGMMPRMGPMQVSGPAGMMHSGPGPMMMSQPGGQMMARGPPPMYGMASGGNPVAGGPSGGPQMGQMGPMGSPAMSVGTMNMVHSPAQFVHSPMSQVGMGSPSPVGAGGGPRGGGGGGGMAPSPLSSANTPQMPQSHDGSGGGGGQPPSATGGPGSQEDQQYLDKVRQLSRYIEPLRDMISRIGNEDKTKLDKMKKLMDILSNPNKRMPMTTLLKCEEVLGRMNFNVDTSGGNVGEAGKEDAPAPASTSSSTVNPLLEAVINLMNKPPASSELNHSLQKSFGASLDAIFGSDITLAPLPEARAGRKRSYDVDDDEDDDGNMRLILDREIAMLEAQYHVEDSGYGEEEGDVGSYNNSGKRRRQSASLVCSLEDSDLPSVPPVTVTIPASYPDDPPRLAEDFACEYETTPFLRRVREALEARLAKMSRLFTLSQLLAAWETSVRAASSPRQRSIAVGRETVLMGL